MTQTRRLIENIGNQTKSFGQSGPMVQKKPVLKSVRPELRNAEKKEHRLTF